MAENRNNSNSTRINIRQENQDHQQDMDNNNNQQYDNNNHACARARARDDGDQAEQMRMIAAAYRANVASKITPVVARMIEEAMAAGMDCDTVIWACEETGLAPNPSPRYLRAVLRNWAWRGHVSSRVHAQERHIETRPWYTLPEDEYKAASVANGESLEWWWQE